MKFDKGYEIRFFSSQTITRNVLVRNWLFDRFGKDRLLLTTARGQRQSGNAFTGRILLNKLDFSFDPPVLLLWPCPIENDRARGARQRNETKRRRTVKSNKTSGKSQSLICSCSHVYLAITRQRWSSVIMNNDEKADEISFSLSLCFSLLPLFCIVLAPVTGISLEATANGNSRVTRNWRVAEQKGKTEIEQRRTSRWIERGAERVRQKSDEHDSECK